MGVDTTDISVAKLKISFVVHCALTICYLPWTGGDVNKEEAHSDVDVSIGLEMHDAAV